MSAAVYLEEVREAISRIDAAIAETACGLEPGRGVESRRVGTAVTIWLLLMSAHGATQIESLHKTQAACLSVVARAPADALAFCVQASVVVPTKS